MNKKTIITTLLALVALTAQAIDVNQFHSGTAVLKGRILNKPDGEWNSLTVSTFNLFSDEEQTHYIPVAADGTFMGTIPLLHAQSVKVKDMDYMFLAVGDTLEITKDAAQVDAEGLTYCGHSTSATINQLWPALRKQYFGDRKLFDLDMPKAEIPAWKQEMVKLMDTVIADIEADRLPLPAGTSAYVKEVLGASLLAEPFEATMENYRYNMTPEGTLFILNPETAKLDEYYDFLAAREKWLLDNPAMLFRVQNSHNLINRIEYYALIELVSISGLKTNRPDTQDFQRVLQKVNTQYNLKHVDLMHQIVFSHYAFREDRIDENSKPDDVAAGFSTIVPFITNPIVARYAVERYRQYVISREGQPMPAVSTTPEGDAVFERIIAPFKGNVLQVHFWGMYCGPCRADMLKEREQVEQMKDLPVRFLYICDEKDSPRESTEQWLQKNNIKGEHIFVTHEEWKLLDVKFQIFAPPFSVMIDKQGRQRKGATLWQLLEE